MSSRPIVALCAAALFAAACSSNPSERTAASPTGPSVVAIPGGTDGGVVRGAVVNFPARADGVQFRTELENKYTAMGRRPAQVFVDMEGEATWVGEYYRYRVNGCDHDTATQRVMAQVDGGAPGQICSLLAFPETAVYPPRDQVVDFRRQLGTKYQSMGRSAQSAVDADGAAIWLGEYYRYRTSGCDHATASQKVMAQIDGAAAPPSCVAACAYFVETPATVSGNGGNFTADLRRTSGTCDWIAVTDTPWITINRPITGTDRTVLSYTVAANTGAPRSGAIQFVYPGGISYLTVQQGAPAYNLAFQFFDPATTSNPVTECQIRGTSTVCTLNAVTATLPAAMASFDWKVEYSYNGSKTRTQVGPLSTFSFTETCGPALPEGAPILLKVTLKATDAAGNSATIVSGQGAQPPLQLRVFSCS
jgi:hypothetical protein